MFCQPVDRHRFATSLASGVPKTCDFAGTTVYVALRTIVYFCMRSTDVVLDSFDADVVDVLIAWSEAAAYWGRVRGASIVTRGLYGGQRGRKRWGFGLVDAARAAVRRRLKQAEQ